MPVNFMPDDVPDWKAKPAGGLAAEQLVPFGDYRPKVLAVDDDPRNLLAIEVVLESVADVVTARSGEEALRLLLKEEFAVILLDVFMPGLDGYETARLLRQRKQSKRIPIIFLTAINKEDAHMLRGYDMGAVDYVFKPFEPTILKSKVAVFVDLFNKTREIREKADLEQRLLEQNLKANAEKLQVEQALRQSEERQALILRSLPLAVYVSERLVAGASPHFIGGDLKNLTGFDSTAFDADPNLWTSRVHPDDKPSLGNLAGTLDASGAAVAQYRWQCADGSYKHFLNHIILLKDAEGVATTVAGTVLDVTDRRELEDQLIQAQKMDAIGKLTGGIAHDFNNLLASILGGLKLIERRMQPTEEVQNIINLTRHAAEQGAGLISRMLTFSRRQQLDPDVLHLSDLAANINGLLGPALGGLIRMNWRVEDDIWPAFVDSRQLELALMNLIINARDAMPDGGTITVRGENQTLSIDNSANLPAGDYVVMVVEDTGCGIPADIIERVIEPFFTTKDVGKGTGLGLSTVYGFARQSGGTLKIASCLDRGTQIGLWLPRSDLKGRQERGPRLPAVPKAPTIHGTAVILLVDDSSSLLATTAALLRDSEFQVVCAGGGAEALAILEKDPDRFDLIITDFAMPIVSGVEVVRFARNLRSDWPAIIITGYGDLTALGARPTGVPVLSKPFTEEELLGAIRSVTSSRIP
ncbi:response regulator [Aurantimonas endophytica]|uniref:histidine kinase n=1 Tax=Aurantimonas endophytica TaxID=1522175 RepID=A0A7W6MQD2_9HYPH|nr:response regulator [Aurantimonas endophytica]MBB4003858.1 signal transduction histidine kinase/ActR/RegA family two-component response regulator [Aurantimonas endophytica]MCO6404709.1 response regulator [Aurantimonas endophytica]